MTANQINYTKHLETERANRASEQLQRQRMWTDWMIANLQAQTAEAKRQSDVAINQAQIESKERMDYFNRQQSWDDRTRTINLVEVPKIEVQSREADTHKEALNVERGKAFLNLASNLLNTAGKVVTGFSVLY